MVNWKKKKKTNVKSRPFVSICTPTYNRRPFISYMIKCFNNQTYPKELMEWIIVDDGTDPIEDLVSHIPQVKYFRIKNKITLGKKRNYMHTHTKGDIIVYMDDDDYYPPERVSHAVEKLTSSKTALCAGSSELYIYFKHIDSMYQFGPYGPQHATAGTFAFKRQLLSKTSYSDEAALAEEKEFLKNYTVPFIQLDPFKTILVFSHEHNTFDKKKLLNNPHPQFVKKTNKTVQMFIKDNDMMDFYMNRIEGYLKDYNPGRPSMKPDVLKQIDEIETRRRKEMEKMNGKICIQQQNGSTQVLENNKVIEILQGQQKYIQKLEQDIKAKDAEIAMLNEVLASKEMNSSKLISEPNLDIISQINSEN
tara:strand:- start:181 stop:1269 length:1089 start_codon:yes stop_codon:yes gene_type:complete